MKKKKLKPHPAIAGLSVNPPPHNDAIRHYNLGNTLRLENQLEGAEISYRTALAINPELVEAHYNLGITLSLLGKVKEAELSYRKALAFKPNLAGVHYNLANLLRIQNNLTEAEQGYRNAIAIDPNLVEAHANLGVVLMDQGDMEAAETSYRNAIAINPNFAASHCNLGIVLATQGKTAEAELCYLKALELNPDFPEAYCNFGNLLKQQGKIKGAELSYLRSLAIKPDYAQMHNNLGILLSEQNRYLEAEEAYQKALYYEPMNPKFMSTWIFTHRKLCSWQAIEGKNAELLACYELPNTDAAEPIALLATENFNPMQLRQAGKLYANCKYKRQLNSAQLSTKIINAHQKLRIGYLSADFHSHATVYLLAGVLENRNSAAFDVYLYSYGVEVQDQGRSRVENACEVFRDLRELSDDAIAQQILADQIDILVDLKGYTQGERLGITALRPAPIIVSWLGYPATLGHERLADYIIGDATVTPLAQAGHFSETLALMPHCYQPNDNRRPIGACPSREQAGLPTTGFVFCTFNQAYKITPETFTLWCRLLAAVPDSVLWLLEPHPATQENLRVEMQARGVDPARLIFAPTLEQTAHLGRLQLADLALDTFPYTSHTTASDALWAGVPLLTKIGATFASRVAASILQTMDLAELVTENDQDYFNLALNLAQNPLRLAALKQKIAEGKQHSPLFDTPGFAHDLERLYRAIWAQEVKGERKPVVLSVEDKRIKPSIEEQRNLLALSNQGLLVETIEGATALISRFPKHGFAWKILGSVLRRLGRIDEALTVAKTVVELFPNDGEAHYNLGNIFSDQNKLQDAQLCYQNAAHYLPDNLNVLAELFFVKRRLCNWTLFAEDQEKLLACSRQITSGQTTANGVCTPFFLLALENFKPSDLYRMGGLFADFSYRSKLNTTPLITKAVHAHQKLRIGYLSADFHSHATAYLLTGVLENRDTEAFDVYLYSYGVEIKDSLRLRIEKACEIFRNVCELSDEAIAQQILADEIDILVDLKGYTTATRLGISALRPAPVIISWLGYPATLGHQRLADYIIGDATVTPLEHAGHFSETLALMPHCYQPNDNRRPIGVCPTRESEGLPAAGFVFCSFNQAYKITPDMFTLWCRLLDAVPDSVLWLLESHPAAQENLRHEIQARGLEPSRLIFAPKREQSEHLGRLQLADLALDTFPCTSHTTASDALWAGVPLVTKIGQTFAGRVAASLLNTLELSELVTTTDEDYFNLALNLVQNPERLTAIKQKIAKNKLSSPLFDTPGFARDLECLYQAIWGQEITGTRKAIVIEPVNSGTDGELRLPFQACPLCQNKSQKTLVKADVRNHPLYNASLPSDLTWLQCTACSHVFTKHFWTEQGLTKIFANAHANQLAGGNFEQKRQTWKPVVHNVLAIAGGYSALQTISPAPLWLDAGCGDGGLVMTAAEFGFNAIGLDARKQTAQALRDSGYQAICGDFMAIEVEGNPFVISMMDVLEHMPNPCAALQRAYALLQPKGVLVISLPNSDCSSWRLIGEANPYWTEIEHYHNFSRQRLSSLLNQYGFDVVHYDIPFRYQAQMELYALKRGRITDPATIHNQPFRLKNQ